MKQISAELSQNWHGYGNGIENTKKRGIIETVIIMDEAKEPQSQSPEEKRRALYDQQVALLATFLEHGAITQAQHDKSLHDLTEKMGYGNN